MIRDCFVEDRNTFSSNDYWGFLSHLHESVKET